MVSKHCLFVCLSVCLFVCLFPIQASTLYTDSEQDQLAAFGSSNTIWLFNIAMENPLYLEGSMGEASINGPCSMAMLNYQMVFDAERSSAGNEL